MISRALSLRTLNTPTSPPSPWLHPGPCISMHFQVSLPTPPHQEPGLVAIGTCPHVHTRWCLTGPVGALREGKMRSQGTPDPSAGVRAAKNGLCTVPALPSACCSHFVPCWTKEGSQGSRELGVWTQEILMLAFGWVFLPPIPRTTMSERGKSRDSVLGQGLGESTGSKTSRRCGRCCLPPGV